MEACPWSAKPGSSACAKIRAGAPGAGLHPASPPELRVSRAVADRCRRFCAGNHNLQRVLDTFMSSGGGRGRPEGTTKESRKKKTLSKFRGRGQSGGRCRDVKLAAALGRLGPGASTRTDATVSSQAAELHRLEEGAGEERVDNNNMGGGCAR